VGVIDYLDKVYNHLDDDVTLEALCANKFKYKQKEETNKYLHTSLKSYISVEISDWTETPTFSVLCASREGAEECLSIMARVKDLLLNSATLATAPNSIWITATEGPVEWDPHLVAWVGILTTQSTITAIPVITSLGATPATPQAEGETIQVVCIATDADSSFSYRFSLNGPSTGSVWQQQTGWVQQNTWTWSPALGDAGNYTLKVEVRDGLHAIGADASETEAYTISADATPSISALTQYPATPQVEGKEIQVICTATDTDTALQYRFSLNGPATGDVWQHKTGWTHQDSWTWGTALGDAGVYTIKAEVRDGKHAVGADDSETDSFTVTANASPTITTYKLTIDDEQLPSVPPTTICTPADTNNDGLFFKFWLKGPATGEEWRDMTGWNKRNAWQWRPNLTPPKMYDLLTRDNRDRVTASGCALSDNADGSFRLTASLADHNLTYPTTFWGKLGRYVVYRYKYISGGSTRDTLFWQTRWHGGSGSYSCYIATINADGAWHTAILDLWNAVSGADDWKRHGITYLRIDFTQAADSVYDFEWVKVLDKNPEELYGTYQMRCWVRDANHNEEGTYDAQSSTLTFTLAEPLAEDCIMPQVDTLTPSLATPQANETTIEFVATASRTDNISYRFWLKGPGTGNVWQDMTGWTRRNSWKWKSIDCDAGTNYIKVEVVDIQENWDDDNLTHQTKQITYVIS
jgi:hypothetical protein